MISKKVLLAIVIWIIPFMFWVINLIQFINCDFVDPYKEEIIHGIGIIIPYAAIITVWF